MKVLPLLYTAVNLLLIQNVYFVAAQENGVTRITGDDDTSTVYTTSTTSTTMSKPYSSSTTKSCKSTKPITTKYSRNSSYAPAPDACLLHMLKYRGLTYNACINWPQDYFCNQSDPYYWPCNPNY